MGGGVSSGSPPPPPLGADDTADDIADETADDTADDIEDDIADDIEETEVEDEDQVEEDDEEEEGLEEGVGEKGGGEAGGGEADGGEDGPGGAQGRGGAQDAQGQRQCSGGGGSGLALFGFGAARHGVSQQARSKAAAALDAALQGHMAPAERGARRQRTPWSRDEVAALELGVSTLGEGHWGIILARFAARFHSRRTDVDLKDKWRNLQRAAGR